MLTKPIERIAVLAILVLAASTTFVHADFEQGMNYFKTGKYVEAAAEFQTLVDQSPAYDFGYYMLGLSFMKIGKLQDAETNFLKAIEIKGDYFNYHHGLATSYFERKQFAKVVATLKTAENLAADDGSKFALYKLRGFAYAELGKLAEAIDDLEAARKFKTTAPILDRLGTAYTQLGYSDKALPVLREALKDAPDNTALLARASSSLLDMGAETRDDGKKKQYYGEALIFAERFQKIAPREWEAHNLCGRAALGAKEYGKAEQAFSRVLAQKPDYCFAMVNLGKTYIAQKKWSDAEGILKDAATCSPKMAVVHESLGFAVQKQNRLAEAIDHYQVAMNIKPSDSVRKAIETCQNNLEVQKDNAEMARLEAEQAEEARKAEEEFAEAKRKEEEWRKARERDQ